MKVALGLPWYDGPDRDTAANQLVFSHYLGRLQERLAWMENGFDPDLEELSKLDPVSRSGLSEVKAGEFPGGIQFSLIEETGCSLPGTARERIVDVALEAGIDKLLMYDDDMMFGTDAFLTLLRDDKPVVGALAFTARNPITPVIYKFVNTSRIRAGVSEPGIDVSAVMEYERDKLHKVDAIGFGMVMLDMKIFEEVPKPWFTTTGMGEDIFFCLRCREYGVEVWVDTRVKTIHKPTFPDRWHDEMTYLKTRQPEAVAV